MARLDSWDQETIDEFHIGGDRYQFRTDQLAEFFTRFMKRTGFRAHRVGRVVKTTAPKKEIAWGLANVMKYGDRSPAPTTSRPKRTTYRSLTEYMERGGTGRRVARPQKLTSKRDVSQGNLKFLEREAKRFERKHEFDRAADHLVVAAAGWAVLGDPLKARQLRTEARELRQMAGAGSAPRARHDATRRPLRQNPFRLMKRRKPSRRRSNRVREEEVRRAEVDQPTIESSSRYSWGRDRSRRGQRRSRSLHGRA